MEHRVARQGRMVGLDVQLEVLHQAILAQEIEASRRIGIILVGGRLPGLWFNVERPFKAYLLLVVDRHVQQGRQVVQLPLHVRVPQGGIAFPAAPEGVAQSAQLVRGVHRRLDLRRPVGEYVRIGRCPRSLGVTRMSKKTGGSPEQLLARLSLLLGQLFHHRFQHPVALRQVVHLRRNVPVMETVEINPHLFHELEKYIHPAQGVIQRITPVVPWHLRRTTSKRVRQLIAHAVPVRRRKPQMLPHRLPLHQLLRIVMLECQRVPAPRPFVPDRPNIEICHALHFIPSLPSLSRAMHACAQFCGGVFAS